MTDSKSQNPEELGPPWTILKLLKWTTNFLEQRQNPSARLDAELLLAHVLKMDRILLYANFDRPLMPDELQVFRELVKRRAANEPVAYIVGQRGFWTLDINTDPRALIPRPDTEVLVEVALKLLSPQSEARVVDIGTGTGAIALAIASERPHVLLAATDLSAQALALAAENAEALGLSKRITFLGGDLFEALDEDWQSVDMIVSNPPYVAETERATLMADVRDFEPQDALFAGPRGLDVIRRLVPEARHKLAAGGHLVVEIGFDQGQEVRDIFTKAGFLDVGLRKDYGGNDRVVYGRMP